jgi:hypothetical protein
MLTKSGIGRKSVSGSTCPYRYEQQAGLHDLQRQTMNVTRRSPHPLFGNAYEL